MVHPTSIYAYTDIRVYVYMDTRTKGLYQDGWGPHLRHAPLQGVCDRQAPVVTDLKLDFTGITVLSHFQTAREAATEVCNKPRVWVCYRRLSVRALGHGMGQCKNLMFMCSIGPLSTEPIKLRVPRKKLENKSQVTVCKMFLF